MAGEKRGPKTAEGKKISSRNALKFGIQSASPVVVGIEDPKAWVKLRTAVLARLEPADGLEQELAERVGQILWRMRRLVWFESYSVEISLARLEDEWLDFHVTALTMERDAPAYMSASQRITREVWMARARAEALVPKESVLGRLMRYEAHLQRQLVRTLRELQILQEVRKGRGDRDGREEAFPRLE